MKVWKGFLRNYRRKKELQKFINNYDRNISKTFKIYESKLYENNNAFVCVLNSRGSIVGAVVIVIQNINNERVSFITHFAIHDKCQGKGYDKKLMIRINYYSSTMNIRNICNITSEQDGLEIKRWKMLIKYENTEYKDTKSHLITSDIQRHTAYRFIHSLGQSKYRYTPSTFSFKEYIKTYDTYMFIDEYVKGVWSISKQFIQIQNDEILCICVNLCLSSVQHAFHMFIDMIATITLKYEDVFVHGYLVGPLADWYTTIKNMDIDEMNSVYLTFNKDNISDCSQIYFPIL